MYEFVCVYACVFDRKSVFEFVCKDMPVCVSICVLCVCVKCVCMHVCIFVRMCAYVWEFVHVCIMLYVTVCLLCICVYCGYVYMCVCTCILAYVSVFMCQNVCHLWECVYLGVCVYLRECRFSRMWEYIVQECMFCVCVVQVYVFICSTVFLLL